MVVVDNLPVVTLTRPKYQGWASISKYKIYVDWGSPQGISINYVGLGQAVGTTQVRQEARSSRR